MKKFYAVYEKNLRNVRKKSMQCRKKIYAINEINLFYI